MCRCSMQSRIEAKYEDGEVRETHIATGERIQYSHCGYTAIQTFEAPFSPLARVRLSTLRFVPLPFSMIVCSVPLSTSCEPAAINKAMTGRQFPSIRTNAHGHFSTLLIVNTTARHTGGGEDTGCYLCRCCCCSFRHK